MHLARGRNLVLAHLQSGLNVKALRAHVAEGHYLAEFPEGTGEVQRGCLVLHRRCTKGARTAHSTTYIYWAMDIASFCSA